MSNYTIPVFDEDGGKPINSPIDWPEMATVVSSRWCETCWTDSHHECDSKIAAQADARIVAINEDAATFRHLLNIAQQVYGFELIGQAFTEINSLRADLEIVRRENNTLNATLVTAREEGKL